MESAEKTKNKLKKKFPHVYPHRDMTGPGASGTSAPAGASGVAAGMGIQTNPHSGIKEPGSRPVRRIYRNRQSPDKRGHTAFGEAVVVGSKKITIAYRGTL